jgi:Flp pilus assembly protein TadD
MMVVPWLLKTGRLVVLVGGCCLCAVAQQNTAKEPLRMSLPESPEESAVAAPDGKAQLLAEIERNPNSAALLYRLGLLLRGENKPQESLQAYTRAAALQKPDAGQLRSVALDYVLLGDFDDAIHWLRVALTFEPRNVEVLYSLGRCLYTQNLFAEAEAAYSQVLKIDPNNLKAEENLGLTFDGENRPEKAEEALRAAVALADKQARPDEWPYLDLGVFLQDQSRVQEALPLLTKAARIAPKSATCRDRLGRALVATGDAAGGVKELQVAAQLDPKNPKIHFELGHAYRDAGDVEDARSEFALSKSLYGEHSQN